MSELYKLPDGWEWKTIEELCEILDRLRKPISQKDRISGEYPYYGATGIVDYINNSKKKVNEIHINCKLKPLMYNLVRNTFSKEEGDFDEKDF